jgi:xylulokinase
MSSYILAYDFGTGGTKASLYNEKGECLAGSFVSCDTFYPKQGWHEQKPAEWWSSVVESTNTLLNSQDIDRDKIVGIGISGHSLGVVPVDADGELLRDQVPIWSDSRPDSQQIDKFFETVDEEEWYMTTGNGFPPALYSVFKLMWFRDNEPEMFDKVHCILGTKDYINYILTGKMATDFSYASGSGVYDLKEWKYSDKLIKASGLDASIFPEIVKSSDVIGTLTAEAAEALGLPQTVKVVAGGVDNSCMALGARCFQDGRVYNSQGSSSWIAVSSSEPVLDPESRPYVFTHVVPGLFASALAIFSAGTTFRWVRDNMCKDLCEQADKDGVDVWNLLTAEAETAPVGSNGLILNPTLAGGTCLDPTPAMRGGLVGIDLSHTRADVLRACMEGIPMGLKVALDNLKNHTQFENEMTIVGGGSKSPFWREIYANVYNMKLVKTNVDQQAAALGAAALVAVGCGLWEDYSQIDNVHEVEVTCEPNAETAAEYAVKLEKYKEVTKALASLV